MANCVLLLGSLYSEHTKRFNPKHSMRKGWLFTIPILCLADCACITCSWCSCGFCSIGSVLESYHSWMWKTWLAWRCPTGSVFSCMSRASIVSLCCQSHSNSVQQTTRTESTNRVNARLTESDTKCPIFYVDICCFKSLL